MTRQRTPTVRKGPAAHYAGSGEAIYEFTDGRSGGLIALRRNEETGQLVLDVYRQDSDVEVRVGRPDGVR